MGHYLKETAVQIPEGTVIRNGKTVEYELDRTYTPKQKSTRVRRKVIGKIDPISPGRMFPNEAYFELFPDNEVPDEIQEEFLRQCAIKRDMAVVKKNPAEIIDRVVEGLHEMQTEAGWPNPDAFEQNDKKGGKHMNPIMVRRMFDEVYYAMETMAEKTPDTVADHYKVKRINEVLTELRECIPEEKRHEYLRLIDELEEKTDENGTITRTGLTYSDIMMTLRWYKVLPR